MKMRRMKQSKCHRRSVTNYDLNLLSSLKSLICFEIKFQMDCADSIWTHWRQKSIPLLWWTGVESHFYHSHWAWRIISRDFKYERNTKWSVSYKRNQNVGWDQFLIELVFEFDFSVNGMVRTDFDTTPIMSTYTIAFVISDMDYTESNEMIGNSIRHRVFSTKSDISHTLYALNYGENILKLFEEYLQVPYGLSKMDQLVSPRITCNGSRLFFFSSLVHIEIFWNPLDEVE